MRVCITARGNNLGSPVDPRFGRCETFLIVDTDTLDVIPLENGGRGSRGGAGIQAGQMISGENVQAVLTGSLGPNAFQTLEAAGIEVFTGITGTAREAVEKYKSGALKPTNGPDAEAHHGMRR